MSKIEFIAEIGMNHNGNFDLCHELIRQASSAGADIAKFQLGWRDGVGEINRHTDASVRNIIESCNFFDIEPLFSVISRKGFELLDKFDVPRIKIASRTLDEDFEFAKELVGLGKPTFVSLGRWSGTEMPFPEATNVRYLYCQSDYPVLPINVKALPERFGSGLRQYSGYSCHWCGIELCLIAISRGASVIEKHFTLDKSDQSIRDHLLSATPVEFANLVKFGTAIGRAQLLV